MSENWREEKEAKQNFDLVPRSALSSTWTRGTRQGCSCLQSPPQEGATPQSCQGECRGALKSREMLTWSSAGTGFQSRVAEKDTQIGISIALSVGGKGKSHQLSAHFTLGRAAH